MIMKMNYDYENENEIEKQEGVWFSFCIFLPPIYLKKRK